MKSRMVIVNNAKLRCQNLVANAGVSSLAPIQTGSYVIVYAEGKIWLGEGKCSIPNPHSIHTHVCVPIT